MHMHRLSLFRAWQIFWPTLFRPPGIKKTERLLPLFCCALAFVFGCSNGEGPHRTNSSYSGHSDYVGADATMIKSSKRIAFAPAQKKSAGSEIAGESPPAGATDNRRIIYSANLHVIVEDFAGVPDAVQSLIRRHGGFVSSSDVGSMQGRSRSGSWTVRVPTSQYQNFLDASGEIGQVASLSQNAEDVSEEFFDAEARINNKKKLEARIVKLLDKSDHKIQHVIEVERELGRVREEIERIEGRLRFLQDRTALATVQLRVREQRNYVPETAQTFTSRTADAWSQSLVRFQRTFENLVVFAVANILGFFTFVILALLTWIIFRGLVFSKTKRSPSAENS